MDYGCSRFLTFLPEAIDKFAAFGEIVRNCSVFDQIADRHAFLESVIKREKLQSTGIGALGLSQDGIRFDDIFPQPVHLVFLIASCPTKQTEYVKALSSLLSWVHDDELRACLIEHRFTSSRAAGFMSMMESQDFRPADQQTSSL